MKRVNSIFLLVLFCVYVFTFKTHYCYYAENGERFHGDCEHEIKAATARGKLAQVNFFPKHYVCHDVLKNATAELTKAISVKKNSADNVFILPTKEILISREQIIDWLLPDVRCRSATEIVSSAPRAPPIV